jgi:hypothetical protein
VSSYFPDPGLLPEGEPMDELGGIPDEGMGDDDPMQRATLEALIAELMAPPPGSEIAKQRRSPEVGGENVGY